MKTSEWEEKVWGRVMHVFSFNNAAVSYLEVDRGYQCSIHYHERRVNHFAVIEGKIRIEEWSIGYGYRVTVLEEGNTHSVPVQVEHRFQVLESGTVVEYYSPSQPDLSVDLDDIVRKNVGGKMKMEGN